MENRKCQGVSSVSIFRSFSAFSKYFSRATAPIKPVWMPKAEGHWRCKRMSNEQLVSCSLLATILLRRPSRWILMLYTDCWQEQITNQACSISFHCDLHWSSMYSNIIKYHQKVCWHVQTCSPKLSYFWDMAWFFTAPVMGLRIELRTRQQRSLAPSPLAAAGHQFPTPISDLSDHSLS